MRDKWYRSKINKVLLGVYFFIVIYLLLFNAVSEYFFWDEFAVRYNFIAVDYLIYTNEVIGNIRQSYPMPLIFSSVLVAALLVFLLVRKRIALSQQDPLRVKNRTPAALLLLLLPGLCFFAVNDSLRNISPDKYVNELSANGMYQFGTAFRKNELDYNEFYATRNEQDAFRQVKELLQTPGAQFTGNDAYDLERKIQPAGELHKWNVVLITVESFSAEYLRYFGNPLRLITARNRATHVRDAFYGFADTQEHFLQQYVFFGYTYGKGAGGA